MLYASWFPPVIIKLTRKGERVWRDFSFHVEFQEKRRYNSYRYSAKPELCTLLANFLHGSIRLKRFEGSIKLKADTFGRKWKCRSQIFMKFGTLTGLCEKLKNPKFYSTVQYISGYWGCPDSWNDCNFFVFEDFHVIQKTLNRQYDTLSIINSILTKL